MEAWSDYSFMLELKPRSEAASLFVDCPPDDTTLTNDSVKILEDRIEVGTNDETQPDLEAAVAKLSGRLTEMKLYPASIGALAWADKHRLFTCKVRSECTDTVLISKTVGRLAHELTETHVSLDSFCQHSLSTKPSLSCINCNNDLLGDNTISELQALPCDQWYETAQTVEYFCHEHSDGAGRATTNHWSPSESRCLVADSYVLIKSRPAGGRVAVTGPILHCQHCMAEIGKLFKGSDTVWQLYHTGVDLSLDKKHFMKERFGSIEHYFAWLLLSQCENQASLKFLIRSCDKTPHMLIWLLDSYSVLVRGCLTRTDTNSQYRPFPVLKALYKIYDETSAASDPRTTGQDSSVAILEQPSAACTQLSKLFLESTHSLPPACKQVGQFYVGFLRLSEKLE